jgi:hypothetical protein
MPDSSQAAPTDPHPSRGTAGLLTLIEAYANARAAADICHDLARTLSDPDRDPVEAEAAQLETDATARHAEIMSALDDLTGTTLHTVPDPHLPVCTWRADIVEIRAVLPDRSRAVRVGYTPAQAISAGAALIACGVAADIRTGGTLGPILPPFPTGPACAEPAGDTTDTHPPVPTTTAHADSVVAHDCEAAGTLKYAGTYGAPGVGQAWDCTACGRGWARVGGHFHPAEQGVHILTPADCI